MTIHTLPLFSFYCFLVSLHDVAINGIVQYTRGFLPYILLFTRAPIPVCLDGTIIDISTILLTIYYSDYVGLWLVAVHGD